MIQSFRYFLQRDRHARQENFRVGFRKNFLLVVAFSWKLKGWDDHL